MLPALFFSIQVVFGQLALTPVTPFEKNENHTATYQEAIDFYTQLDARYEEMRLDEWGSSDAGLPLHVATISLDKDFDPDSIRKKGNCIVLVNNAIHPGEPDGVDATMMLFRDLLQDPAKRKLLEHTVIVAIPMYNLGGVLNRNSTTRANQNGPESYGFRGNSRNLDLNRDFIKCDSKEAQTFSQIFHFWQPDVFVDNHVSNGADYTYTMTLLPTQKDKLSPVLTSYLEETLVPDLYARMEKKSWPMVPYMNTNGPPETGLYGYLDLPRYSTGYAAVFDCIGFMPETHMLKPFRDRVRSTYAFMETLLEVLSRDRERLHNLRTEARIATAQQKTFDLDWSLDQSRVDSLLFRGYAAKYKPSEVTGQDRLYYDRNEPYEKNIPYYPHFTPTLTIESPEAYVIPQGYTDVLDRLRWNGIELHRLTMDVEIPVGQYYIRNYKDRRGPYEGHYLHSEVEVEQVERTVLFRKGDFVVFTAQPGKRFLLSVLEPQAPDSYFCWNFFDSNLDQKEYFSSYVFEDLAAEFLRTHPEVREELEARKKENPEFAANARGQLDWVYRHSPWYEPTHRLYPVARLLELLKLPLILEGD
ncbi:MAG: M14 family metallopeptidase [Saprospirales bacterium]|nr:M14 family metallopeptidase [Saprospirales bacterium]